jgi:hypothetical protein
LCGRRVAGVGYVVVGRWCCVSVSAWVFAVRWQWWGIVWLDGLFWVRAVGCPLVESVVGVVGLACVGWLVSGSLVGV